MVILLSNLNSTRQSSAVPTSLGRISTEPPERLREQVEEYHILDFSNWEDRASFERMYRRLIEGLDLFYKKKGYERA